MEKTTAEKFNAAPTPDEKPVAAAAPAATSNAPAGKPAPKTEESLYSRPIPRHLWKYVM